MSSITLVKFLTDICGTVCVSQGKVIGFKANCKTDIRRIFRIGHIVKETNSRYMFVQGQEMSAVR